jgi:hypothetical protein
MSTRPGMQILNRDAHIASWYHHAPYGVYQCKDAEMAVSTNSLPKPAEALNSDELRAIQTSLVPITSLVPMIRCKAT